MKLSVWTAEIQQIMPPCVKGILPKPIMSGTLLLVAEPLHSDVEQVIGEAPH